MYEAAIHSVNLYVGCLLAI